jgi:hypothetical protein
MSTDPTKPKALSLQAIHNCFKALINRSNYRGYLVSKEHYDALAAADVGKGKTLDDLTVQDFDRVTAAARRYQGEHRMTAEELHAIINHAVTTVNNMDSATRLTAINSGLLDRSFQIIIPTEEDVELLRQAVFTAKEAVANMSDILEATNEAYHSARQAVEKSTTVSAPTQSYDGWSAEELNELIGIIPTQTKTIELTDELWNKQRNAATQRFYGIDADTFSSCYIAGQIDNSSGCLMAVLMFFPELD